MDQDVNYYKALLDKHGPTHAAVDAGSQYTHQRRLQVLAEVIKNHTDSVLDVGCGLGHFLDYGPACRKEDYLGIDILPEMVEAALLRRPGWRFEEGDIEKPNPLWVADYVVASGLFQFAEDPFMILKNMYDLSRKAVAVNFLREGTIEEYVCEPWLVLNMAFRLTPYVTLRADYLPNDFTLYLYKEKQ